MRRRDAQLLQMGEDQNHGGNNIPTSLLMDVKWCLVKGYNCYFLEHIMLGMFITCEDYKSLLKLSS